jgi:predicted transcriptional regulator
MLAFNQQAVRDQFKNLGITGANVPETIAELRALVDAQDESTDAGKKLKYALMALAPSFVDVINAQEEARQEILAAEKAAQDKITSERQSLEKQLLTATGNTAEIRRLELESLDASNRALQERIWALEDEKKAQQELAQASQGVTSEIDRLKKSLSGSTEAQSAAALQAQFATTTAQARSGDLTALSKLPTISSALKHCRSLALHLLRRQFLRFRLSI